MPIPRIDHANVEPGRRSGISQKHIDWLITRLMRIQEYLPTNSQLGKDIGNIVGRFKAEILDENSAGALLSLSTEAKFFRMVDDLNAICEKEKTDYDKLKSHIPEQDHYTMLALLEEILRLVNERFGNIKKV